MPPRPQPNAARYPDRILGFKIFGEKEDRGGAFRRDLLGGQKGMDLKNGLGSGRSIKGRGGRSPGPGVWVLGLGPHVFTGRAMPRAGGGGAAVPVGGAGDGGVSEPVAGDWPTEVRGQRRAAAIRRNVLCYAQVRLLCPGSGRWGRLKRPEAGRKATCAWRPSQPSGSL
jgi:hypothetical protein